MDMKQRIAGEIAKAEACCFENCGISAEELVAMMEIPPDKKLGDFALPCFRLSKSLRRAPQAIASALAQKLCCEEIERAEVVGGYLNVFLKRSCMARSIVEAVLAQPGRWAPAMWAGERRSAWIIPRSTSPSVFTSAICPPR